MIPKNEFIQVLDPLNFCKTNLLCLFIGHDVEVTDEHEFYHEKGERRLMRTYFYGKIEYCKRKKCEYEKFYGNRTPTRKTITINNVEYDMGEEPTL